MGSITYYGLQNFLIICLKLKLIMKINFLLNIVLKILEELSYEDYLEAYELKLNLDEIQRGKIVIEWESDESLMFRVPKIKKNRRNRLKRLKKQNQGVKLNKNYK